MEEINDILKIDESPAYDNSIENEKIIKISPTCGSNLDDSIEFINEAHNLYLLPSKSYLYLEGNLTKLDGSNLTTNDKVTLTNNAPLFLFDRAIYSLDGKQIEDVNNPGRASLMKGLLSYSSNLS